MTDRVAFTGKLCVKRATAVLLAKRAGLDVCRSVTKNTTHVVVGRLHRLSRKLAKAGRYNVKVISEREFMRKIGGPEQLAFTSENTLVD